MAIYYGLPVGVNYWRGDTTADDYLVTQSLTLAENNYLVSFEYLGLGLPEKVVVVYGNAPEASALTNVLDTIELGRTEEVVNDIFHKELNITTEDEYYFGLHIISDTSGFIFYVADFNVMVNPTEIDADLNITQTEITTYVNRNVVIRGTLENNGAAINSYELVCKEGEEVLQTVTYSDLDMVIGMYHAFSFDPIQFETAGTHNLVVDVTKINGVDCNETPIAVTVIANEEPICNVETVPYTENFNDGMPECWLTIDNNNDGYTWSSFTELLAAQNITVDASELIYEGADALTIWSFKPTNYNVATEEWNGQNTQLDDYVLTPEISIPSEGAVVTYYHMNLDGSTYPEKYSVYITTTTNVADFVLLEGNIVPPSGTQAAPYAEKTIAIPAEYNGQNVRIVFYNNTAAKFGMFIDNFAVTVPTAVEENIASAVSVYPNPANNVVTIANAEGQNVVVVNSLGQVVASVENATANHTIDLSNFANGTYFVKVGAEVVKLNIVK